ncbi:hypothetical protein H1S01_01395 [Heliobacterium chlorum]|uniref:Uncharacterized protein n=1 Tax=Heliobacterium chlorum TaxID=2698 RepID=A0ABR7T0G1_HELCL|nr:hypothetical protein [Heliobacterium chlorum]MBC9783161.1 hypothetical protein [Heliobacterium chlorum]
MSTLERDIEKIFKRDQREKKVAASGVRGRASRLGRVGRMVFPSDRLSPKEKRQYRQAGALIVYSLYDQLVSFDEFDRMAYLRQRELLTKWRTKYSDNEICRAWGLSRYAYEIILEALELPKKSQLTYKGQ